MDGPVRRSLRRQGSIRRQDHRRTEGHHPGLRRCRRGQPETYALQRAVRPRRRDPHPDRRDRLGRRGHPGRLVASIRRRQVGPTRRRSPDRPALHRYRRPCRRPGTIPSRHPRQAASHPLRSCRHTRHRRRAHPPTARPLRRGTREPTTTTRRRRRRSRMRRNGPGRTDPRTTDNDAQVQGADPDALETVSPDDPTWAMEAAVDVDDPIEEPAQATDWLDRICPYLLSEDGTSRSSQPDERHRCTAQDPPATLPLAFQERFCLTDRHVRCEMYKVAEDARSQALAQDSIPAEQVRKARFRPTVRSRPVALESSSSAPADPPAAAGPDRQILIALGELARSPSSCSSSRSCLAEEAAAEGHRTSW